MSFFPGWATLLPAAQKKAEKRKLPKPFKATWFDPIPLRGFGAPVAAVSETFGTPSVAVRAFMPDVEATFLVPDVFGVVLLDSFRVSDGEECALVLDVFDDDRTTILWSVGSKPTHAHPYLVEPDQYAQQEIDVGAGSATLGTISVTLIDYPLVAGDQDGGYVTRRLAEFGIGNLAGRRCRLRRFISSGLGSQVIADGPASAPALHETYAGFTWQIRDTRETERKVALFSAVDQSRLPNAPLSGYGHDYDADTYLIEPAEPLLGKVIAGLHPPTFPIEITIGPYNATIPRTLSDVLFEFLSSAETTAEFLDPAIIPIRPNPKGIVFHWRLAGSGDPWTEIENPRIWLFTLARLMIGPVGPTVFSILLGCDDLGLLPPLAGGSDPNIELYMTAPLAASETDPAYIEGLTAGEFARNVYAGLYSSRGAFGELVPTGILYDEAALLAMTAPVRIRATAVEENARDWLEKNIYAPLGYFPALDKAGLISPLSQVPPLDFLSLARIEDAASEPSADWSAGEKVVNVLRLTYQRDYRPDDPANAETVDGLADREVTVEFRQEDSIARYGEQLLEIAGEAFRAIGGSVGEPLAAGREAEVGWRLAQDRGYYLLNRYAFAAPVIQINVLRSAIPNLRAGSWVIANLSWLPDYVTQRRGLLALGQIIALGEVDCVWRAVLIEQVIPPEAS